MTFDDILEQVIALLKRQGRVSYPALKVRFKLEEDYLEALKAELLFAYPIGDENERGLVWNGETERTSETASQPDQTSEFEPVIEHTQPNDYVKIPSIDPHTPDAERRQLTVMFCDLVGSTSLSGQLDPEDLRDVIREYQSTCSEVIQRYDGHVAQLLGDGLLVYFGYPQAHEDDAQRAVYTGLGMVKAINDMNVRLSQNKGVKLAMRLGVHTGLVVIGEMGGEGRQEQLALGEVPNVAARIQGLAEPDTVVISSDTHRLVEGYFNCAALGEHELKGVSEPMSVYRVLQASGIQSRLEVAGTRGLTPLIGREQELGLLLERWEQSREGNGQVILLSGEAGIGKSRLVQVLKDHVTDEPHISLECRSSPYYQNSALYPITDLLQRTLRWQQDDTPEQRLDKLEHELKHYRLPLEETIPLFATLLSLPVPEDRYPSLALSPQRQREKTLETIVAIILELSERQRVLFILEDLHWTDPTTLEFIDLLIEQTPTACLYLLLTGRPEFQSQWANRSYSTQITLNRLSRDGIEQMATKVSDGKSLPDEVLQQLVDKSDGVPLYVEEMTKAVLETGVVKETDEHYELTGPLSSLSIPATLQDSLMARLDRLVTAKGLAQQASVIGRQFAYELLQAVSQLDDTILRYELKRLVDAELLNQRGAPPQATYAFKHALIQDTAYESLLRATRQQVHHRIVQVLETRFPEIAQSQPEVLAYHAAQAGLHESAVKYWHRAGQEAVERSAYLEAIEHYQKALDVLRTLPDTPERAEQELVLLIAIGQPLNITKGYGSSDVERVYALAHALCQKLEDSPHLFSTLLELGRSSVFHAEYERVRELGEQLLAFAEQLQEPERFLEAHFTLGTALLWMGELDTSLFHIEKSRSLYESQHHATRRLVSGHAHEVGCLTYEARALWFLGYPDQALTRSYDALTRARDLSHPFSQARALTFVAHLHHYRREAQQAQSYSEELLAISREQGYIHWVSYGMILRAWALAIQGQVEQGVCQIEEGMVAQERMGHRHARIWWLLMLAEVHRVGHHVEDGLHALAEVFALIEDTGQRVLEAETHRLKGELLLQPASDCILEVEASFLKAIFVAQNQSAKSLELRAATSLARFWQSQGKRDEARELLEPVYSWFTEGFDTADLIDAKALLVELEEGR